jgi:hypothetical protein
MRIRSRLGGAAASTLLLLFGATIPVAAGTSVSPEIITAGSASAIRPVGAWGASTKIGELLLTPGNWVVTAQATLANTTGVARSTRCILRVDPATDTSWTSLRGSGWATIFSHLIAQTSQPNGTMLTWHCASQTGAAGSVNARSIRLVAYKVGQVRTLNLKSGDSSTTGSGAPRTISGHHAGPLNVPTTAKTLASIPLPIGRWIVLGKAVVGNTDDTNNIGVRCSLAPGHVRSRTFLGPDGSQLGRQLLAWQAHVNFPRRAGSLGLTCQASRPGARLSSLRLTAIEVPGSFNQELPTAAASTQPAQVFWKDAQLQARNEWADQLVTNGHWVVLVTAEMYDPFNDGGGPISCFIEQLGVDEHGRSGLIFHSAGTPGSEYAFTVSAAFTINQPLADNRRIIVSCLGASGEGEYLGGRRAHVRIVMLRASGIWDQTPT